MHGLFGATINSHAIIDLGSETWSQMATSKSIMCRWLGPKCAGCISWESRRGNKPNISDSVEEFNRMVSKDHETMEA
jgi:hypothetical protein